MKKNIFTWLVLFAILTGQILVAEQSDNLRGGSPSTVEDEYWYKAQIARYSALAAPLITVIAGFCSIPLSRRNVHYGDIANFGFAATAVVMTQMLNFYFATGVLLNIYENDGTYQNSELSKVSPGWFEASYWTSIASLGAMAAVGITRRTLSAMKKPAAESGVFRGFYGAGIVGVAVGDFLQWFTFEGRN